jgi:putative ABC transport system permease protein
VGVLLAAWTLRWLVPAAARVLPIPSVEQVRVDTTVLAFALTAALATVAVFALIPALAISRLHLQDALRPGGRSSVGDRGRRGLRRGLAMAQLALAFRLLIGAGRMITSLARPSAVDPGLRADHVLTMRLLLPESRYPKPSDRVAFMDRLIAEVRHLSDCAWRSAPGRAGWSPASSARARSWWHRAF